ncbi:hypothetical protein D9615_000088 [Tricholomella constricta]|uniref:BOD1/SHG1 domain-containing protein n=1 Tax=Tricholomella constricta TaxID=117010 RepID=A0A8H5HQ67_9AGAR|nr:hypothetical protein D9615_000088 [Tricholomella constricta]
MPIDNPTQLVDEFKKSGEFDRLRRELLAQVSQGAGMTTLKTRVEEVAQQRFTSDPKLSFMSQEAIYRELMQEMERFPVVDRVAADVQLLSDPLFTENIRKSVHNILLESKGQKKPPQKDEKGEATETPASATPGAIRPSTSSHPEQASIPRLSIVVTPAPQSPCVNQTTPPPITTLREPRAQALESPMETTKKAVIPAATASSSSVSGPPILTTSGADVEMADGS